MSLTPGTAKLTERSDHLLLNFVIPGSFTVGYQRLGNNDFGKAAVLRFCRERNLQLVGGQAMALPRTLVGA